MSQEKQLPATAKQRERFREEGDIARSRDLSGVAGLAAGLLALSALWSQLSQLMVGSVRGTLGSLDAIDVPSAVSNAGVTLLFIALPVGVSVALAGLVVGLIQSRGQIFWTSLKIDFTRLNPLPKLQQTYGSPEALINLALQVVKVFGMAAVCGSVLYAIIPGLIRQVNVHPGAALMLQVILPLGLSGLGAYFVIGIVDYLVSWYRLERKMRMTHQEVRDDQKQSDGDPKVKQRRRQRAVELVRERSVKAVPTSDVIVVNPTHYSVALKYDPDSMSAPRVVAKGLDAHALKIREIAGEHQIPIVSEPPLARFLYAKVKVGRSVPGEAYEAVAKVLAHVYRLRRGARR